MNTKIAKKLAGKVTSDRFETVGLFFMKATGQTLTFIIIAGLVIGEFGNALNLYEQKVSASGSPL